MTSEKIAVTVKGQRIIDAVKKVAESPVISYDYVDGRDRYTIGQTSMSPYEHIIVTADGLKQIDPLATYNEISVKEHDWGGECYAIGYGQEAVIEAVKDFAQKLRDELSVQSKQGIVMKTRIEKYGSSKNEGENLFIATLNEQDNEHSPGAVSHIVGKHHVSIRSTSKSWGAIPVEGKENLQLLRDALIEICKMENIK